MKSQRVLRSLGVASILVACATLSARAQVLEAADTDIHTPESTSASAVENAEWNGFTNEDSGAAYGDYYTGELDNPVMIVEETATEGEVLDFEVSSTRFTKQFNPVPLESDDGARTAIPAARTERTPPSYLGLGVNFGLTSSDPDSSDSPSRGTGLSDASFTVVSKVGLSRTVSVRPSVVIGNATAFLIPVTYDFNIRENNVAEPVGVYPYVGGGVLFSTREDDHIGAVVTGGLDFPFSRQFTATAAVNAGFKKFTEVGLVVGVGYNFSGF